MLEDNKYYWHGDSDPREFLVNNLCTLGVCGTTMWENSCECVRAITDPTKLWLTNGAVVANVMCFTRLDKDTEEVRAYNPVMSRIKFEFEYDSQLPMDAEGSPKDPWCTFITKSVYAETVEDGWKLLKSCSVIPNHRIVKHNSGACYHYVKLKGGQGKRKLLINADDLSHYWPMPLNPSVSEEDKKLAAEIADILLNIRS